MKCNYLLAAGKHLSNGQKLDDSIYACDHEY